MSMTIDLKDVAEADDFLKQHVYFPLKENYVGSKSSTSLSNSKCLLAHCRKCGKLVTFLC